MLNLEQAKNLINKTFTNTKIQKFIEHNELFIFMVLVEDPDEQEYDPFYSVDKITGKIEDYSILDGKYSKEVIEKFTKLMEGG